MYTDNYVCVCASIYVCMQCMYGMACRSVAFCIA